MLPYPPKSAQSLSDLDIAHAATLQPIAKIATKAGIPEDALIAHGRYIAKLEPSFITSLKARKKGKLVLVTAINPTPAGEGKTTTTIGLGDALNRIGKKTVIALREPSLGPVFGSKGGATGGGYAQVLPMEAINLHFTGDFHAITAAHNLLAAMIDNHIHWGNALDIDPRRISWRRVMDMNDRALRQTVIALGGPQNGFPREDGFDITVASEVMAILCLAEDLADMEARLSRMVVAQTRAAKPVTAGELKAVGAMMALLKEAANPNLVQTIEGSLALLHGGPFANIAHGCNSVIATKAALALGDYVVTEAGFGADLGAEKFLDIKCRQAGLSPDCVVIVATLQALKMHGGVTKTDLKIENLDALALGLKNLGRHVENIRKFGLPVIVAINHFTFDTEAEHALLKKTCAEDFNVEAITCRHWADGAKGAETLAQRVAQTCEASTAQFRTLYTDDLPLKAKIETIAREIYRADGIVLSDKAAKQLAAIVGGPYASLPVCVAKTQYSFSGDPLLRGAPTGHVLNVRELRLSAGAGFVVAICGDIMTMPGLPRVPSAESIGLDAQGEIEGLF